jgi:transposase
MATSSMPQDDQAERPAHDLGEPVLGVDTHKDIHVAAVISALGTLLGCEEFSAGEVGYQQLLAWARTSGKVTRAGVEGTGS